MSEGTWECEEQELIPADVIMPARLDDLVSDSYSWEGKEIHKLRWVFEITEGAHKGRKVNVDTGAKLSTHPNNKFRTIAEALLQREVPVGFKLCREDLTNLACKITVAHVPDKKDKAILWERVDVVMPIGAYFDTNPPF